ncbi:type I-U CRISPR-associated RAMP protein Csb1/Cas7u [Lapillicoccus sp.]|uniref:type I-G CRISPR-associated RAMP protein Csb1/Cas7g n=1 Tax=Lapillicoccus sp. TaxID=1909287 RepID=UPI0025F95567|nr:type I-U CRISPR-associated RAMP protein Csb1/Cas7u [Lapillicoccus sp.]
MTLVEANSPGGATCLTSRTELEPAGGPQMAVAPAKFAMRNRDGGAYAYETRYLDGAPARAVLIDSKQSVLNRCEAAVAAAIDEGHPVLSRLPRIEVRYERDAAVEEYSDLTLPHRAFDGHIRAGSVDGTPVTQLEQYRAVRNATPGSARALLDASPVTLVFGGWDSSRATRQGRWRSILVGEIIGFCADDAATNPGLKGGARVDPVGMKIELTEAAMKQLATNQRSELSGATYDKAVKEAAKAKGGKGVSASMLGLGGIPPTLEALAGVACHRIVRSHVLSFAALRQLRFGAGPEGDAACRALLAALALNALARSDAELVLRANCDLREAGPVMVELDGRGGQVRQLDGLTIPEADALLDAALTHAEATAGVAWDGPVMHVQGNPSIVAGAVADGQDDGA